MRVIPSITTRRVLHQHRLVILITMIILGIYIAGYGLARNQHLLVHYVAYVDGKIDSYRIDVGDLGTGYNPAYHLAHFSDYVFTPMRWIESGYWYLRYPVGSSWPY